MTDFCGQTNRREFISTVGGGFTSLALTGMMAQGKKKETDFAPKAKSVIFLFMYGGPSHIDTFDYKPGMKGMDGKTVKVKTFGRGGKKMKAVSLSQNGISSSMANVVSGFLISSHISRPASMTSPFSIRLPQNRLFTARRC
jgi:hypothetical protein